MSYTSLIHWGSSKEAHIFWASSWTSSTFGIFPSSHHHLGVSTTHPLPLYPLFIAFCCGFCGKVASSTFPTLGSWLLEETLHIRPQLWWGVQVRFQERWCSPSPSHCGGLCVGEWVGLLSGKALWCLLLCPQDLLFHLS